MARRFTSNEWQKIHSLLQESGEEFGLPERRDDSVVIGTFNIRKLGKIKGRSEQSWQFLRDTISRFDLIAIQEVMDDLSGMEYLLEMLGGDYGMVVSDVTGVKPGERGNPERLGYIFNWKRVNRTAMASDITYDRSEIANNLYDHRTDFGGAWEKHTRKMGRWEEKAEQRRAVGKRAPSKPGLSLPRFVSFIRQPHYVSFRIPGAEGAAPYEFMVVNAHLLYGTDKKERKWEFFALVDWLTVRAKQADKLYHKNLLLLGDCNLDFDSEITNMREVVDDHIKGLNKKYLRSKKAATANFPILTPHPKKGVLRTALRQEQTYDQIGFFVRDKRLPVPDDNHTAGETPGGYNYDVFNMADLFAKALFGEGIEELTKKEQKSVFKKAEFDVSDHMPTWVRLPLPT